MHSAVICLPDFQHAQHSSVRWMIFCCHQRERRLSLCTLFLCPFASSSWGRTQHPLHPCSPEQVGSPECTDPNVNLKSQFEHKCHISDPTLKTFGPEVTSLCWVAGPADDCPWARLQLRAGGLSCAAAERPRGLFSCCLKEARNGECGVDQPSCHPAPRWKPAVPAECHQAQAVSLFSLESPAGWLDWCYVVLIWLAATVSCSEALKGRILIKKMLMGVAALSPAPTTLMFGGEAAKTQLFCWRSHRVKWHKATAGARQSFSASGDVWDEGGGRQEELPSE